MLTKRMEDELNAQIVAEMFSSNLYLSMSSYYEAANLKGFANWMKVQAQEEMAHAMKFYDYILSRGGRSIIGAIEAPKVSWENVTNVFDDVMEHEKKITGSINHLVKVAREEIDYASENFLQWFVAEQVEEEANVSEILEQLKMIDGKGAGLFMMDRELKLRVFVPIDTTTGN